MGTQSRWAQAALASPVLVFLGALLFGPVVALVLLSAESLAGAAPWQWSGAALWAPWTDPYLRARGAWTLWQATCTTAVAGALGVPLAWVLQRMEFPGRSAMERLLLLPFVVPTLVAAMGVLALWGPRGWLAQALGLAGSELGGWMLLYGNLFFNLCVVVRPTMAALARINGAHLAAARVLGATPWRVFVRVEWPQIRAAVLAGACLVFLYCFTGLGLALVLGGQHYATLEVEIYTLVAHELALGPASVLALWIAAGGMALTLVYAQLAKADATPLRRQPLERLRPAGLGGWALVWFSGGVFMLFVLLPLVFIGIGAINSVADWGRLLGDDEVLLALYNTGRFTLCTVLVSLVLGLLHGLAAWHWRWMRVLLFAPMTVSSVMVAFGLLVLYPAHSGALWVLLGGYVLVAYPLVAQPVVAALDTLPPQWLASARLLGASPWRAFWRVTLPLLMPALRRGGAMAAATAIGEFAVTLFLSRPEWLTLTTLIYQRLGRPGATNGSDALVLSAVLLAMAYGVFRLVEGRSDEEARHA